MALGRVLRRGRCECASSEVQIQACIGVWRVGEQTSNAISIPTPNPRTSRICHAQCTTEFATAKKPYTRTNSPPTRARARNLHPSATRLSRCGFVRRRALARTVQLWRFSVERQPYVHRTTKPRAQSSVTVVSHKPHKFCVKKRRFERGIIAGSVESLRKGENMQSVIRVCAVLRCQPGIV